METASCPQNCDTPLLRRRRGRDAAGVEQGSNGYVYFVATSAGGPLTQLPHTTPAQIKAARHLKKLLTGRLTSQVSSYPVFPGTEANYLRAQVRA